MQGFNMGRYVPPDHEGQATGNQLAGKHPLGARARHLRTTGALVVRFEMPFAVWCTHCAARQETLIAQGVRFNAEKRRVGSYYSTPVYSFRMRHPPCGGWIEIRTDPKNTAYVVTEGARRRDTGEEKRDLDLGEIRIRLPGEEEDKKDAFARLEGKVADKRRAETESSRVQELRTLQDRDWDDPYEKSKRLRRAFRAERKGLQRAEEIKEALKDKMSLGIDLVDETEEDRVRAAMVDFGAVPGDAAHTTRIRPMFDSSPPPASTKDRGKRGKRPTGEAAERKALLLRQELRGNTRTATDPFLSGEKVWRPDIRIRKGPKIVPNSNHHHDDRDGDDDDDDGIEKPSISPPVEPPVDPPPLVDYASDSE
ncbi:hypothetical protein VTN02DRAFT_6461 [Thermoascus thermophilus]